MKYRAMHNPDHPSGQDMEFIFEMDKGIISTVEVARRLNATEANEEKILDYCEPHLDEMWAANIVGILLDCDFRNAKEHLAAWKDKR